MFNLSSDQIIASLRKVVGAKYVLTDERATERYRQGYRSGEGEALAVIRPGTLKEYWDVLKICIDADVIIIMQAANTGLTEGSTPKGEYDRQVVIISTLRMTSIYPIDEGKQAICFAGSTLYELENIAGKYDRQPHSVIGSSCIGASVIGGVCNNSGGSLIERGPSYTELSIYAQRNEDGSLELVNNLGIDLGDTPEEILTNLEKGNFDGKIRYSNDKVASDTDYARRVRNVDADSAARFNADKRRLYEASGCAGKLAVFAVRLDTYELNDKECIFYIGTNDTSDLTELRRHMLKTFSSLPVSAEYVHREIFDFAKQYGKDSLFLIDVLGTSRLPQFFEWKGVIDSRLNSIPFLPKNLLDRCLQLVARLTPNILPKFMLKYRDKFEHHLILKMHGQGIEDARVYLSQLAKETGLEFHECSEREGKIASLHRFVAAGTPVRFEAVHPQKLSDIVALDIALRRNDQDWFEELPEEISKHILHKLYYGHFFCHVFHQDYIIKKGSDPKALKEKMLETLRQRGAQYPAEHNVGHLYEADEDQAEFFRKLDPTNTFNPGIGKTSRDKSYGCGCGSGHNK